MILEQNKVNVLA